MAGDRLDWGRKPAEDEECGIQALLDEALLGGAKGLPLEPLNLDVRIQKDWGAPSPVIPKGSSSSPSSGTEDPHEGRILKRELSLAQVPAGPPLRKRVETPRVPQESMPPIAVWGLSLRRPALAVFLLVFLCGLGLLSFTPPEHTDLSVVMGEAARLHSEGDYQGALQHYSLLRQSEGTVNGSALARLAFLEAGAAEGLWRKGIEAEDSFARAVHRYEDAVQADQTPMRIYASEALMAKAEMHVTRAQASQPHDVSAALVARTSLEALVLTPAYSASPVVATGLAHRRLAELICAEAPQKAIDLLNLSKDRQGSFSEGLEDLSIARIYRDYLRDEDRAFEYYSSVKTNPLASGTNRRTAETALGEIRGTDLHAPDTLDLRALENMPLLKAD